ncbi:AAA family ATPase [Ancylobacter amanitiformis]|uniref:SpoVK/Ycf46/Vps4 family AAA+-type ATPase n=1 Tax=Ancylobacter amanitiformis TaxID=217069 RepID=A0ABU0LXM5_9HYPH|nr:ATP-binding protein [Ancylobacter amanitiformis]MDQ0513472.1 SpoVK/Ycf46/Vps4 family AAA+-type ATPase [Ancylobacter amanitiformis]
MTIRHILALLDSHAEGDEERLLSIALSIAANEARAGHIDDADALKKAVQRVRAARRGAAISTAAPIPLARPRGELHGIIDSSYPKANLSSMVLGTGTAEKLARVVRQQEARAMLREHGQTPASHLLLIGPPGTGKTMTSAALAAELRLPLFTIKLESVFSRYMGETAGKLRLVFDQVAAMRGVYLIDEFDAIGARRGDPNDVGEMRRILNSVLSFMEEPNSTDSIVVAATNHVEILDHALARRFDEVIEYNLPTADEGVVILKARLGKFKLAAKVLKGLREELGGLSQGEIVRAADSAVREAILDGRSEIASDHLTTMLRDRKAFRDRFHSVS